MASIMTVVRMSRERRNWIYACSPGEGDDICARELFCHCVLRCRVTVEDDEDELDRVESREEESVHRNYVHPGHTQITCTSLSDASGARPSASPSKRKSHSRAGATQQRAGGPT